MRPDLRSYLRLHYHPLVTRPVVFPRLTVVATGQGWFEVDVSEETMSKTTLADWKIGAPVNLERSLKLGDELGGHMVSGHVDGVARIFFPGAPVVVGDPSKGDPSKGGQEQKGAEKKAPAKK